MIPKNRLYVLLVFCVPHCISYICFRPIILKFGIAIIVVVVVLGVPIIIDTFDDCMISNCTFRNKKASGVDGFNEVEDVKIFFF
jgi:hypothetical protein